MITNKNINNSIEKTYIKFSPIEHVLKKPGMYVGDLDFRNEKQLIYSNDKVIQKNINWSPGLYKIIDELIVNAYDQTLRDKTVSTVKATITENYFTISNDGVGIDIVKHPNYKIYIPELIFANLLTSTNYDETEQRITGGTHGLGAKLSAIFSTKFIIEVWDKKRKLYYYQVLENNLSNISKPTIEKNNENKGGVKITIYPDFNRFGGTKNFSQDMIDLISRRIIDLVGLCNENISVSLNSKLINKRGYEEYLSLFSSEETWIHGKCIKNQLWGFSVRFNNGKDIDFGTHLTFVNGIYTNRGGKHLDYILELLLDKLQKLVSPELTKKILHDYLSIYLKVSVINPTFNSQTKEELNTPPNKFGFDCVISDSFWNQLKNTDFIDKLKQVVSLSNQKILSKLDGTKKSKIKNIPKLEDANFAGSKKSTECSLILTEGDSAKATAISGISAISNGRNYFGVYPLRGKLLNVREASTAQINNNQEITDIKKILGLKSGTVYNKDNINELRYGSVIIMTDADEDGSHIKGLIINFFDYFFPSLLEIEGFLRILVTPLVKVFKDSKTLSFSNLRSYKIWCQNHGDCKTWKVKYYKGLGTSTSKEAGEYFQKLDTNIINLVDTQKLGKNPDILLAFAKEKVNDRKLWLGNYNPDNILQLNPPSTVTIKEFVNQELIHFSNYDNIRSIPLLADGFKPSQRKVLYTCLKRNLTTELKVAQLAASVAEQSAYHHGEQSLVATIINMCQDFVGANNINLLLPQGQFGTRLMGGKDHSSARYIYTMIQPYLSLIFNKLDDELLEYLEEEGQQIEPKYYLPIIPLILVNGTEGIGTGFSTSIPNYNPLNIIDWLHSKLTGKRNKESLIPYYRNFKGKLYKFDDSTWVSEGIINIDEKKNELHITELPIKLWTNDYKEFLEDLIYEQRESLFKSYTNLSSDINIHFILRFNSDNFNEINKLYMTKDSNNLNHLLKYLHLYKTVKTSNMNLYTIDYKIKNYKTPEEILEEFYIWRLSFYNRRKELLIRNIKNDQQYYSNQVKFIKLVMDKKDILRLNEEELTKTLVKNKIDKYNDNYDYLINMTFKQLTQNNLDKLEDKLKKLKSELSNIESKTNKDLWVEDLDNLKNKLV